MGKSKPFDIVFFLFKPVWEAHEQYKGTIYRPTGRDLKEAKEFYELNPTIFDEVIEFQEHAQEFLKSKFGAWQELKHPCWAFLRNYNTYAPKVKLEPKSPRLMRIRCVDHGTEHGAFEVCPRCAEENESLIKGGKT